MDVFNGTVPRLDVIEACPSNYDSNFFALHFIQCVVPFIRVACLA